MNNIVSLDLGYAQTKISSDTYTNKFQSITKARACVVASDMHDSEGYLIAYEGSAWNVGSKGYYDFTRERLAHGSDIPKLLTALALYKQGTGKTSIDMLVSGLPISDYRIQSYKEDFKRALEGGFRFGFCGKEVYVRVLEALVLPQSAGAYYDYVLGDDGNVEQLQLVDSNVLIIDVGGKTTDCCIMEGGLFSQDSFSLEQAVWQIHKELRSLIALEYRYMLPLPELDNAVRTKHIELAGKQIDISRLVDMACNNAFRNFSIELSNNVEDFRRYSVILLCGGGASLYKDLLSAYCNIPVHVAPNPEYSNVEGYKKYAKLKLREGD